MKVTTNIVAESVEPAVKACMESLVKDEEILHRNGYTVYATEVANMRYKIETAFNELIDKLMELHG